MRCRAMSRTRNKTRNRNAWMWLAIAAVAFTSVAHAETGRQSSKGYAHPVFEFLVRSQTQNSGALSGCVCESGLTASGQLMLSAAAPAR